MRMKTSFRLPIITKLKTNSKIHNCVIELSNSEISIKNINNTSLTLDMAFLRQCNSNRLSEMNATGIIENDLKTDEIKELFCSIVRVFNNYVEKISDTQKKFNLLHRTKTFYYVREKQ